MKFLFITDTHFRSNSPRSRRDDFQMSMVSKMNEIGDIISKEKIDYVLHGGDLFDRPDIPFKTASLFSKILLSYKVPIYIISGNHDSYGQNPVTIDRSILGLLASLNIVNLIDYNTVLLKEENLTVQLYGTPYRYDLDRNPLNYSFERVKDADFCIQMAHGFILRKPFLQGIDYTLVEDLKDSNADILFSGHYHSGFEKVKINKTLFYNPGSLARMSNSKTEQNRNPKVVLVEVLKLNNTVKYTIQDIYLKSAKPGKEVISRSIVDQNKMRMENLIYFKQAIHENLDLSKYNIFSILNDISPKKGFDASLISDARTRILEAAEEIGEHNV